MQPGGCHCLSADAGASQEPGRHFEYRGSVVSQGQRPPPGHTSRVTQHQAVISRSLAAGWSMCCQSCWRSPRSSEHACITGQLECAPPGCCPGRTAAQHAGARRQRQRAGCCCSSSHLAEALKARLQDLHLRRAALGAVKVRLEPACCPGVSARVIFARRCAQLEPLTCARPWARALGSARSGRPPSACPAAGPAPAARLCRRPSLQRPSLRRP